MAAPIVGHCCCSKRASAHHEFNKKSYSPRNVIVLSYNGRTPLSHSNNPEEKKDNIRGVGGGKLTLLKWKLLLLNDFEKLVGKRPQQKQNLSPQQNGDWKDLLLMSISFAVYVYISQKLVCAYYAWTYMPKQLW